MPETPAEKARRLGVPLIPKIDKPSPYNINHTVSVCGECSLEIKRMMGYVCPKSNCPSGLGGLT